MFIPKYSAQAQPPGWLAEVQLRKGNCTRTKRAALEADQLIGDETGWKELRSIWLPIKRTKRGFAGAIIHRDMSGFQVRIAPVSSRHEIAGRISVLSNRRDGIWVHVPDQRFGNS
jgi:hypothetical protein